MVLGFWIIRNQEPFIAVTFIWNEIKFEIQI